MSAKRDLEIIQGKTFSNILRWETPPIKYKPITAITNDAPARVTCPAHGVPDGWRVAIVSVKGMVQINASNPPKQNEFVQATVVDADTLELNTVNSSEFKPYASGGYVQYNTPVDLTGMTARLVIRDKVGGTELVRLTTENGGITISPSTHTIRLTISALETTDYQWKKGVYELEMVDGDVVTLLMTGNASLVKEVAT